MSVTAILSLRGYIIYPRQYEVRIIITGDRVQEFPGEAVGGEVDEALGHVESDMAKLLPGIRLFTGMLYVVLCALETVTDLG